MTPLVRWVRPVVIAMLAALALVAVFHMQLSAANYDPQYMRVLVERTIRLGGSYYENGIHNKGPLEPVVYELAGRIGGRSGFWFVIAIFTMITTVVIAAATAIATAARRWTACRRDRRGGDDGDAPDVVGQRLRGGALFAQHDGRAPGGGVRRRRVGRGVAVRSDAGSVP